MTGKDDGKSPSNGPRLDILRPVYVPTETRSRSLSPLTTPRNSLQVVDTLLRRRSIETTPCPGPSPQNELAETSNRDSDNTKTDLELRTLLKSSLVHLQTTNFTPTASCREDDDKAFHYCEVLGPNLCAKCLERNGKREVTSRLEKQFPNVSSRVSSRRNSFNFPQSNATAKQSAPCEKKRQEFAEQNSNRIHVTLPSIEIDFIGKNKTEEKPPIDEDNFRPRVSFPPI